MNNNISLSKIAAPYANALFLFCVDEDIVHQVAADFYNLKQVANETDNLISCLNNPVIDFDKKHQILTRTLKSRVNEQTFRFLVVLLKRGRIDALKSIIDKFLVGVDRFGSIKRVKIVTALKFTRRQENLLEKVLAKWLNCREVKVHFQVDSNLIAGFSVETESRILDFTIKRKLEMLASHLGCILTF
jgi:F-type H+-transporting ATPase subunit delta